MCDHCPLGGRACQGLEIPRLCDLVDPSHPNYTPSYLAVLAPDRIEYEPPDPETTRLNSLMMACPHRSRPACGCSTGICAKLGREVVVYECHKCINAGNNI